MNIYIGADHNGYALKAAVTEFLTRAGFTVHDAGDSENNPDDDYPQFAERAIRAMQAGPVDGRGILICGSGQGMCISANRFRGIRASLGYDLESARSSRNDDDANVLCLPARSLSAEQAESIVKAWLDTPFAGASRFRRRIKEMDDLR